MLCSDTQSCLTLCDPMDYRLPGSFVHGDSPGKNTGVGRHALLQGIFPTQESNPGLSCCRQIFLLTEPPEKPKNTGMGSLSLLQGNLSKPGIKLGSPALQMDSLPAELPGKPLSNTIFCSKKPEPLEEMVDSWAKSGKEQLSLDCLLFQKVRIETGSR